MSDATSSDGSDFDAASRLRAGRRAARFGRVARFGSAARFGRSERRGPLTAVVLAVALVASAPGCGAEDDAGESGSGSSGATAPDRGVATTTTGSGVAGTGDQESDTAEANSGDAVGELRPLSRSDDGWIVDDAGRQVLLRGVNVTSLGEYWQGDSDHEPTRAMTDEDWDAMAARGFSVVRLVISWSRVEPERGVFDEAYLEEIERAVDEAEARGMYTVIDMHQDAFSAFVFTPDGVECPAGTNPAKGWDGAPEWATLTDGLDTCLTGDRNSSPAVIAAWNHFWDNTDGIRDEFVASWAAVATRFAGRPAVAGYDLLNEPEVSRPGDALTPSYDALVRDTVTAIRDAENGAGASFDHLLFVEPAIPAGDPMHGIVIPDPARIGLAPTDVVAAPHNYAESIGFDEVTLEDMNELYVSVADGLGVPTWIGEYGWWGTDDESLEELGRMARDLDARQLGGAWWQWRQPCGDPHSVPWGGWDGAEPGEIVHLHTLGCPGDIDLGPTEALLEVVGRGYPRATPGRIDSFESDWTTGALTLRATAGAADVGQTLVVWTPTGDASHPVSTSGAATLTDVVGQAVAGGRIVTATVTVPGDYELNIG